MQVPKTFTEWPKDAPIRPASNIVELYEKGFAGALYDPEGKEKFHHDMQWSHGAEAASQFGIAESGAGQLVVPFIHVLKTFPGCWPGAAQERGDCVSHSNKNGVLVTFACDIVSGKPDEATGKVEGAPDIPAKGIKEGVLSSEYHYWWRGYNGDGWSCSTAANVAVKRGCMLRTAYPDLGIDLTEYSGRLAGTYGSRQPPENILAAGQQHLVRTSTELSSFEEIRDFAFNGYGISSCGSEGFSSTRDENGVSARRGSWAHAMAYIGADDRETTKQKYGGPLVLVLNSWGIWNGGPRRIMGTDIDIPEGSFWARWSDLKRRDCYAFSGFNGWPRKNLPDWGTSKKLG